MPYLSMASRSMPMPKAKPCQIVRVDAGGGEHLGVDHAGAEDLEPVVAFADPELAAGEGAADVDLGRGLGEGEVARRGT